MSTTLNTIEENGVAVPTIRLTAHLETHGGAPIEIDAVDKASGLRGALNRVGIARNEVLHSLQKDQKGVALDGRKGDLNDTVSVEYAARYAEDQARHDDRTKLLGAFLNAVLDNRKNPADAAPARDRLDVHNGGHQLSSLAVGLLVPAIVPECGKAVDTLLNGKPLTMAPEDHGRRQAYASLIEQHARAAKVADYAEPLIAIIRTGETDHVVLQRALAAGKSVPETVQTMDMYTPLRDVRSLRAPSAQPA